MRDVITFFVQIRQSDSFSEQAGKQLLNMEPEAVVAFRLEHPAEAACHSLPRSIHALQVVSLTPLADAMPRRLDLLLVLAATGQSCLRADTKN